jgi:hypothetical protein
LSKPVRVAAFFKTKKQGMVVANIRGADFDNWIAKAKEAKAAGKGLVCFLFFNEGREGGPIAALTVDVERDQEGYSDRNDGNSGSGGGGGRAGGGGGGFRGRRPASTTVAPKADRLDGLFGGSGGGAPDTETGANW